MDIDKLIERLRTESLYKDNATLKIMDLCMEAAESLERLNNFDNSQSAKLLEENTQLRAERDAALDDLNGLCWRCIHGKLFNYLLSEENKK